MTDKKYWLYLAKIKGLASARRKLILDIFESPEGIFKAGEQELKKTVLLEDYHIDQILANRKVDYEKEEEVLKEKGINFVSMEDEGFPRRLKDIPDAPAFLFYKGELPDDDLPGIAVVGSRKCSIYGREMCLCFSEKLAQAGINIISGMAFGVDGFAHRGALKTGGKTYAVLGCGVDICYPADNRDIYRELSDGAEARNRGGIISEYYPGERALPYNFPQRNRIISGLADAVLVVEAGKKSGTFITVDHALEQGKEIFAIPGRIGDAASDGCNSLIKNGAMIATEPEDIIDELKKHYEMLLSFEKKKKKQVPVKLTGFEKEVYESLQSYPEQINIISERTGIAIGDLSQALIGLELKGMAEEVGKNLYIRK